MTRIELIKSRQQVRKTSQIRATTPDGQDAPGARPAPRPAPQLQSEGDRREILNVVLF